MPPTPTPSEREPALSAGVAALYLVAVAGNVAWSATVGTGGGWPVASLGLVVLGLGASRRFRVGDDPTRLELAVEKVTGLLALGAGGVLLWPLAVALRAGAANFVGTAVVGVLGLVSVVVGVALLAGYHPGQGEP